MTLAASGTMSLGGSTSTRSVNLEIGNPASQPISMNTAAVRTLAGFPTAGTSYSMTAFYGKTFTATGPQNFGGTYERTTLLQAPCTTTVSFSTDGNIGGTGSGSVSFDTLTADNWYTPVTTSIGNSYWIRATLSSGVTPTGSALNTWLQLSSNRTWSVSRSTLGSSSAVLSVQISSSATGTPVVCSGSVTVTAFVDA